jgi:TonB family protein
MKGKCVAGVLVLSCLSLHDVAGKPSNIFYRVSPPNMPLKLEPVLYAPYFEYPPAARKQGLEGRGLFEIHINRDGSVRSVQTLRTIGHSILDTAAINGMRQWRFRRNTIAVVRMPVQYRIKRSSVQWGLRKNLKDIGDGDGVVIVSERS